VREPRARLRAAVARRPEHANHAPNRWRATLNRLSCAIDLRLRAGRATAHALHAARAVRTRAIHAALDAAGSAWRPRAPTHNGSRDRRGVGVKEHREQRDGPARDALEVLQVWTIEAHRAGDVDRDGDADRAGKRVEQTMTARDRGVRVRRGLGGVVDGFARGAPRLVREVARPARREAKHRGERGARRDVRRAAVEVEELGHGGEAQHGAGHGNAAKSRGAPVRAVRTSDTRGG